LPEAAVNFALEPLEPSEPPRDAAERVLAEAYVQAQQIRDQARAQGYAEGHAAGLADAGKALEGSAQALSAALAELMQMRAQVADEVEREAVELALALAGKIVVSTLQIRPELVVEVLQGALRRVSGERTMAIVVNPSDVEIVRGALGELQAASTTSEQWDLQSDQRVPVGGAIVRTAESEVDARIATQLERAHEVVAAELGRRGGPES
jgi:flagellar assembly protein FliH